jgi:hypothetical protein
LDRAAGEQRQSPSKSGGRVVELGAPAVKLQQLDRRYVAGAERGQHFGGGRESVWSDGNSAATGDFT